MPDLHEVSTAILARYLTVHVGVIVVSHDASFADVRLRQGLAPWMLNEHCNHCFELLPHELIYFLILLIIDNNTIWMTPRVKRVLEGSKCMRR